MQRHDLERRLRTEGYRFTVQRRAILEALHALGCARDAEEIYQRARRVYPPLGRVTVYRTLEALIRERLAQPVFLGEDRTRYELTERGTHHHHLVCLTCGAVRRLDECLVRPLGRAASRHRFVITDHRLELFGYCPRCRPHRARPIGAAKKRR